MIGKKCSSCGNDCFIRVKLCTCGYKFPAAKKSRYKTPMQPRKCPSNVQKQLRFKVNTIVLESLL